MKVVLTTVNEASVTILDKTVGKIGRGFLLLVGFTFGDNEELVSKMVDKILNLRVLFCRVQTSGFNLQNT